MHICEECEEVCGCDGVEEMDEDYNPLMCFHECPEAEGAAMERSKRIITHRQLDSGHTVVMIEIRGYIFAATYAPGSDISDKAVRKDLREGGYGKRKAFRPYDQSRGVYLS
jgi:hypothetical protein